jgi:hypothetical protein
MAANTVRIMPPVGYLSITGASWVKQVVRVSNVMVVFVDSIFFISFSL